MSENLICTHCGAPLRPPAQGGICQRCLLETALESREQDIRREVLELDAGADRVAYIRAVCSEDPALGERMLAWLAQRSTGGSAAPSNSSSGDTRDAARAIGRYQLLEKIGEGGMGEV